MKPCVVSFGIRLQIHIGIVGRMLEFFLWRLRRSLRKWCSIQETYNKVTELICMPVVGLLSTSARFSGFAHYKMLE